MNQERSCRSGLCRAWHAIFLLACVLQVVPSGSVDAQGVLLQGIVDVEGWSTDTTSNLLTRNAGNPGAVLRLQVWSAIEVGQRAVVYGQVEVEGGSASTEDEDEKFKPEIYQLAARYTLSPRLIVDAGKSTHPMSTFAARRFSSRNPLIGTPDGYTQQYPLIVQFSGANSIVDYRVAGAALPLSHDDYIPTPGEAWRPVIVAGLTPFIGMRLGVAATWGPYLSDDYTSAQLHQKSWKDYRQRIIAIDAQFSRGYFEMRGEHSRSSYDVPGHDGANRGTDTYVEATYTFNPRFFAAARAERNNYPFIRSAGPTFWISTRTDFDNAELGVGYRISTESLLKLSYRVDKWTVTDANRANVRPGGHAIAVQFSQSFDIMSMLARPE